MNHDDLTFEVHTIIETTSTRVRALPHGRASSQRRRRRSAAATPVWQRPKTARVQPDETQIRV